MGTKPEWQEDLPPREVKFVQNYCCNPECFFNATESYRLTFDSKSTEVAEAAGCRMIKRPRVKAAIRRLLQQQQDEKDEETKYKVLDIIATIIETTPDELFDDKWNLKPLSELGKKSVCITGLTKRGGSAPEKVELARREKYIELFVRYMNLIRPDPIRVDVNLPVVEVAAKSPSIEEWNKSNE